MRISDWSSDVCSSDLVAGAGCRERGLRARIARDEGFEDLFADLVGVRAGRRAEPGDEVGGLGVHRAHRFLQHARRQPSPAGVRGANLAAVAKSEEHTSELQSLMRTSYAVFCLKKKTTT